MKNMSSGRERNPRPPGAVHTNGTFHSSMQSIVNDKVKIK
jgi:hypothetical protein